MTEKFGKTQPLKPPTAADVLEVFAHFQEGLLKRIDERDENVLKLIQKTVSDLLEDNHKLHLRSDDHEKRINQHSRDIEELQKKHNEIKNELQTLKLRLPSR
jgi:peptidoglycan hydrolase CwlO-like protein